MVKKKAEKKVEKKVEKKAEKINSAISGKVMNDSGIVGDGCLVK